MHTKQSLQIILASDLNLCHSEAAVCTYSIQILYSEEGAFPTYTRPDREQITDVNETVLCTAHKTSKEHVQKAKLKLKNKF